MEVENLETQDLSKDKEKIGLDREFMKEENKPSPMKIAISVLAVILLGVGSGYLLFNKSQAGEKTVVGTVEPEKIKEGAVFGSPNQVFKDTAIGVLEMGGVNGEGTHKLIREGGPSQTAYLTSSVLDLDQFAGKKVQVWGETYQAQRAGWLMDVGRVKIIE